MQYVNVGSRKAPKYLRLDEKGDGVVVVDFDDRVLPPHLIPDLIGAISRGYDALSEEEIEAIYFEWNGSGGDVQ